MQYKYKLLHFAVYLLSGILSPMFAVGLAIGKEYGDKRAKGNHWCWYDIAADALGVALAVVIRCFVL